jgi:hypothetical protein
LLLDEPDSHLHPSNQRKLVSKLINLAKSSGVQLIISTHSRHIIDELQGYSKMQWVRNGSIAKEGQFDELKVLLDLGALDKGDLLFQDKLKCVVLTEDMDFIPLKSILEASGFKTKTLEIWAYKGCTNVETALVLNGLFKGHAPSTNVLLHRDRDYYNDIEIKVFKKTIEDAGMSCFITRGTDIESYYLSADHINYLYPKITKIRAKDLLEESINSAQPKSMEKFINSRTQIEIKNCRKIGKDPNKINNWKISHQADEDYKQSPVKYCHGKSVLGILLGKIQKEIGDNADLFRVSEFIRDEDLEKIAAQIWSK